MKRIVVHWPRLGPYHLARLRGADKLFSGFGITVTALEIAGMDRTYGWKKEVGATPFERVTLFPDCYYEDLDLTEMRSAIYTALDELAPEAIAINGYAFKDSQICLDWCTSRRCKAILMTETTEKDKPRFLVREVAKRLYLRRFMVAFCGGTRHRDYLISLGFPSYRIFTKYDVVDNDYFARPISATAALESLPGLKDPRPFFLASSRFIPRKNLELLVTAYAKYRAQKRNGWRLVLLGSGEEQGRLIQRVEDEQIPDVTFAGFRQIEELPAYYSAAKCFVHPPLHEPWGLVVNEAMAAGLPVIVSQDVGCAPDLVRLGENGFLFNPRNARELADAMRQISGDEDLQKKMSRRSREIISSWTLADFARGLWDAFEAPNETYRVVYFGNRKVLAYRDQNIQQKLVNIGRIETFTMRRRMAVNAVRAGIISRADKLCFPKGTLADPSFLSADIWHALQEVQERLGYREVDYTFSWPAERKRRRTYAYVFDRNGKGCAFVKLSEAGEAAVLANGFKTLQSLTDSTHPRFKFPRPLTFGISGNVCFHVTECVPLERKKMRTRLETISAEECVESYGGPTTTIKSEELQNRSWWRQFWQAIDSASQFAELIRQDQRLNTKCRRVHGDLTIANLIPSGEHIWVIDWELSDPSGPRLTDIVTFFLGQRQRDLSKRPQRSLEQFRQRFIDNRSQGEQRDARLALAFLYGVNSGLGKSLVHAWNQAVE